jgi:tRNA threonylcarbamoyladenosine modification (KEOPS) complex  Pcc1 subunit
MKAELEIECERPDTVIKALSPDIEETKKFNVKLEDEKDKIRLTIESDNLSGLLAGINSYVTLIKTSINTMEEI